MKLIKKALYVSVFALPVILIGIYSLQNNLSIGPIILSLTLFPVVGIFMANKKFTGAIPDLIFGAIDTGLLTIPALFGGFFFGILGAIVGGVIGDAVTDGIAGFFEGGISEWLRKKGIEESREAVTTALGKMAGCLFGSGFILTVILLFGIKPSDWGR